VGGAPVSQGPPGRAVDARGLPVLPLITDAQTSPAKSKRTARRTKPKGGSTTK
jgi:hypothetical protein